VAGTLPSVRCARTSKYALIACHPKMRPRGHRLHQCAGPFPWGRGARRVAPIGSQECRFGIVTVPNGCGRARPDTNAIPCSATSTTASCVTLAACGTAREDSLDRAIFVAGIPRPSLQLDRRVAVQPRWSQQATATLLGMPRCDKWRRSRAG
jgi:hypothetical protein